MSSRTHVPASHARQVSTDEELTLQGEFGWAVYDVQRLIGRIFDRRMREIGLTRAQGRVLAVLRRDDGQTQTAIADRLDMERAPLGKLVDRLEEAGFVTRCIDEGDRRVKRVFLTDKISQVAPHMQAVGEQIFDLALAGLSEDDLEQTTDLLLRIKTNLMSHEAGEPEK